MDNTSNREGLTLHQSKDRELYPEVYVNVNTGTFSDQSSLFPDPFQSGADNPNGDSGSNAEEYAILINGTSPTQNQGIIIPASTFIIRVNAGTYEMSGPRVKSGTSVTATLSAVTGFTGDFPVADGYNLFTVYGKVVFTKDTDGFISGTTGATSIIVEEGNQFSSTVGWSKLDEANPEHVFQIGSVAGSKKGLQRAVFVSQVHTGPYKSAVAANPAWSDFDQATKTIELGGGSAAKVDKVTFTSDGETLLNIDADDFTVANGKPIKVAKLVETDSAGVTTDKGHVLASQDIDITDKDVEWAKYNGSSTTAGSLEIGGSNTSGVTNIDVEMTSGSKMTLKDGLGDTLELSSAGGETGIMLKASGTATRCTIGDDSMDNGFSFNCISAGTSGRSSMGKANLILEKETYGGVGIRADDIPTSHNSEAKFREVKVCHNGVPATAYILMTLPKND